MAISRTGIGSADPFGGNVLPIRPMTTSRIAWKALITPSTISLEAR